MSSSITIPARRPSNCSPSLSSSFNSTPSSTSSTPPTTSSSSSPSRTTHPDHERRRSLLGASLSAQSSTVINIGHPDGPPRLITFLTSSQGFSWNQEIFLPSHSSAPDYPRRPESETVHEIVVTDEEAGELLPS